MMSSGKFESSKKRKHNKNYYINSAKKQKSGSLEVGQKGILITCNNRERQCVCEAYNLLNEYGDILYGSEIKERNEMERSSHDDIELELAKEIEALKSEKHLRRFQQVNTRVKNVIFIKTTVPEPLSLVNLIFEDILKNKKRKTRYILKMTPVVLTCKPSKDDLKKALSEFLEQFSHKMKDEPVLYKILCKIRNNTDASKEHIIWYVRETIEKYLPSWTPSLVDPETIISVDVLQCVCCIGILRNFTTFKKYNLSELIPFSSSDADDKTEPVVEDCKEQSDE